jgi:hypothetical protein
MCSCLTVGGLAIQSGSSFPVPNRPWTSQPRNSHWPQSCRGTCLSSLCPRSACHPNLPSVSCGGISPPQCRHAFTRTQSRYPSLFSFHSQCESFSPSPSRLWCPKLKHAPVSICLLSTEFYPPLLGSALLHTYPYRIFRTLYLTFGRGSWPIIYGRSHLLLQFAYGGHFLGQAIYFGTLLGNRLKFYGLCSWHQLLPPGFPRSLYKRIKLQIPDTYV